MSTLTELGNRLVSAGVGTLATDLFLGPMPMGVANCLAVALMNSGSPIRAMGAVSGAPVADTPGFQVTVRHTDHTAGETRVKAVIDAFDFYSGTIGATPYLLITLEYGPVYLGLDENNRHRWTLTFRATKVRS